MPSRHLGLVQADEVADIDARLDLAGQALGRLQPDIPAPVAFVRPAQAAAQASTLRLLDGVTVAIARDEAFAFLYPANMDTLRKLGAQVRYFSPLRDASLPEADALYLPGGYPELHLATLSGNVGMRAAVAAHHRAGKPIVAECGGMLTLLDTLAAHDGEPVPMWGLLAGQGAMQARLVNLGMHTMALPAGSLRGHTFHHASMQSPLTPVSHTEAARFNGQPEAVYQIGRLHASFMHLYFASNPVATAALFRP
jgi:cobyrinic acid a,c-diamide synthase